MSIAENLLKIRAEIPENVKLVAVSKTKPNEAILEAYQQGQRIFGENKVQELCRKYEELPDDIQWHFIGHLQSNKVKYLAPFVHLIHAVDSLKLLKTINKEAVKNERTIDCLLQFHIADEESKFGFTPGKVKDLLESDEFDQLKNVRIVGVMGMATYTDDIEQIRQEFKALHAVFQQLKQDYFHDNDSFCERSMGMSNDFKIAVEEGSTMVRIGSTIFGERAHH